MGNERTAGMPEYADEHIAQVGYDERSFVSSVDGDQDDALDGQVSSDLDARATARST